MGAGLPASPTTREVAGSFLIISIGISNDTPDVARQVIEAYTASQVHVVLAGVGRKPLT